MDRIVTDPNICNGKPTVKGTRITAQTILGYLAAGDTAQEVLEAYPSLSADDIQAVLLFASAVMEQGFTVKSVA